MANLIVFWNICVVLFVSTMTVSARPNIIEDSLGHLQHSFANIQKNVVGQLTGITKGTIGNFPLIPNVYGQLQIGQGRPMGGLNFQNQRPQHGNIEVPHNQRFPTDGVGNSPNYNQFKPPLNYAQTSASATASASSSSYGGNPNHHNNNQPNGNLYPPNNPNSNTHSGHHNNYNQYNGNRPNFDRYPNQDTHNYGGTDRNNQFNQNRPNYDKSPAQSGNLANANTGYHDNNVKPVIETIDDIPPPNNPPTANTQDENVSNNKTTTSGNSQESSGKTTTIKETKTEVKKTDKVTTIEGSADEEQIYSIDIRNGDGDA